MDPAYFPQPDVYMPERFEEGSNMYKDYAFFPFGIGPRSCVANRLGQIMSKAVVAKIVANYKLELLNKGDLGYGTTTLSLVPNEKIYINFIPNPSTSA